MEFLELVKQWWMFIVGAGTVLGSVSKYFYNRRQNRQKSFNMLFDTMEEMKQKLILGTKKEISYITELQKEKMLSMEQEQKLQKELNYMKGLLHDLERHCPNCYERIIKSNNNDDDDG